MKQSRISMLLLLACWLLLAGAYCLCGPPGPFGFLPLDLGYAILGAIAAAAGFLAFTYAVKARGPQKIVLIVLASLGMLGGLFFASLWLPMFVLYAK